jgi:hypothetical protein
MSSLSWWQEHRDRQSHCLTLTLTDNWVFGRPGHFATSAYRDFLLHDLPQLLEIVPLAVRARMWYMRDGAPAHFSCAVRHVLHTTYHEWWVGRGKASMFGRFDSSGFVSVGKTFVYATPVDNEEALHHCTVDACQTSRNFPGIFERI